MRRILSYKVILLILLSLTLFSLFNWTSTKLAVRDFIYLTRPVWETKPKGWQVIPHYYTPGLNQSHLCRLHNWKKRSNGAKVIDTVIFSIELDLLEIRIKELWHLVDHFIVLEADKTFTGRQKPLLLKENLDKFSWAKDKLRYEEYNGLVSLPPGESPFTNEAQMRVHMTRVVHRFAKEGDIIICSDVDEIPSAHTIELLKDCDGFPNNMHLELKMYLYSFEFFFSTDDSWRAHISIFTNSFEYRHGRLSDNLLADSGWHCSFCFRFLKDFIFKMTSYSHNDRVTHQKLLDKSEIQRKICNGDDVYDMYPEVYSFKEMFLKFGSIPKSKTMTNLPKHLLENPTKFAFLLPNGCTREDLVEQSDQSRR